LFGSSSGALRFWDPGALSGGGSLANRLPSPSGVFWLTNGSAGRLVHPVRLWLKSGLRGQKLHCPARLKRHPGGQEEPLSDDVMIAVDPHKASDTAAVLDWVSKTVVEWARFADTGDG
jgi:hypothetical protein